MVVAVNNAKGSCIVDRTGRVLAWNEGDLPFVQATIELEEVAALNKDVRINVKQVGNTITLGIVESGKSVVALPQEKRIIY